MTKTDPFASLSEFKPKEPTEAPRPTSSDVRRLADDHGFTTENNVAQRRYFRRPGERSAPMMNASLRIQISDWNKFQEFCEKSGLTARRGFEVLVSKLPDSAA